MKGLDIEIPSGSTSDKIAGYALVVLGATSERGLNNIVQGIEGTANMYVLSFTDPTAVSNMVTNEINKLMSESGAMDEVLEAMNAANNTILLLKKGINIANTAGAVGTNFVDLCLTKSDAVCVPSSKECTKIYAASIKLLLTNLYFSAKLLVIDFYNSIVCTSCDATIDNVTNTIDNILNLVEPHLNPILQLYTGYTIAEVRSLCTQGFLYVKMFLRLAMEKGNDKRKTKKKGETAKAKRILKEKEKELALLQANDLANEIAAAAKNQGLQTAEDAKAAYNEIANTAKEASMTAANDIKEAGQLQIDDIKLKSQEALDNLISDFSEEEIKDKFFNWINSQSIILLNAFHILIIKDMIEDIKLNCEKLGQASIENFADFVNALNSVFEILEAIGIRPDSKGITVDDMIALGIGTVGMAKTVADSVVNLANALYSQGKNELNNTIAAATDAGKNIASSTVDSVKSTGTNIAGNATNTVNSQLESAKSTIANSQESINSTLNEGINTVLDKAAEAGSAAMSQGSAVMNNTLNTVASNISSTLQSTQAIDNDTFITIDDISINQEDSTSYNIAATLIDEVNKALLKDILNENFQISGKAIFSNGEKNTISKKLKEIWEADKTTTFSISTKVLKVTRTYIFTITVNKTKKEEAILEQRETMLSSEALSLKALGESSAQSIVDNTYSNTAGMVTAGTQATQAFAALNMAAASLLGSNTVNMVSGSAIGIATNALNSSKSVVTDAIGGLDRMKGSLSGLAPTLDMSYVDAILKDKVLMFDPIILLFKILLPVIEILTMLCHLLENYYTNKDTVEKKAHKNMMASVKAVALKVKGLKDYIETEGTNVFPVRTKELADWCINEFNLTLDKECTAKLDIALTIKFNAHIVLKGIDWVHGGTDQVLSTFKPTLLIFDNHSIEAGDAHDGSFAGMSNIEITDDGIYYDAQGRSPMTSQICRAISYGEDPIYKDGPDIEIEKDALENFMSAITIQSDDMEGLQAIDLASMNVCDTEPLLPTDDNTIDTSLNIAIIEFGDESTKGDAVDFKWVVKPGLSITEDTTIAYMQKGSNTQEVRSIFTKGIVKAIGDEFYHIYPNSANRHIIIEGYEEGAGTSYNFDDTSAMCKKFSESSEVATLIITNMCYSALPIMLFNSKRSIKVANTNKQFFDYVADTEKLIEEYGDKIKAASDTKLDKTTPATMKAQGDKLLSLRKELINSIINLYERASIIECNGDKNFSDCTKLAFGTNSNIDKFEIGGDIYENYYVNLLANVNISSDNEWNHRYYNLLKDIIYRRNTKEGYNFSTIVSEFNTLWHNGIDKNCENPFLLVYNNFKGKKAEYKEIYDFIKQLYIYTKSSNKSRLLYQTLSDEIEPVLEPSLVSNDMTANTNNFAISSSKKALAALDKQLGNVRSKKDWYDTQEKTIASDDNNKNMYALCRLLANIYLYLQTVLPANIDTLSLPTNIISISNTDNNEVETWAERATYVYTEQYKEEIDKTQENPVEFSILKYNEICETYNTDIIREMAFCSFLDELSGRALLPSISTKLYNLITSILENSDISKEVKDEFIQLYNTYVDKAEEDPIGITLPKIESIFTKYNTKLARMIAFNRLMNEIACTLLDPDLTIKFYNIISYLAKKLSADKIIVNAATLSRATKDYIRNYEAYLLVKEEYVELTTFWKEVITTYNTNYDIDKLILDFSEMVINMNRGAIWPLYSQITIGGKSMRLYEFCNIEEEEKPSVDDMEILLPPEDITMPDTAISMDESDNKDIKDGSQSYSIMDFEYWLVYFTNATLISAMPQYWADGFDIPTPGGPVPTPMPGIYMPLYLPKINGISLNPLYIKPINLLLVFGIGIRGIWPWPIVLMINCGSADINAMVPIMIALNTSKSIMTLACDILELGIPTLIRGMINNLTESNLLLRLKYEKFKVYAELIKSIPQEDKALIEKEFKAALYGNEYDTRQVVTRIEKLNKGEDPM